MSKWTKFRIILHCMDSQERIREILGKPLPADIEAYDDDEGWDAVVSECHLPIGSEGSLRYSTFPNSGGFLVVIVGNLRDYRVEQGQAWYKDIMPKFKYANAEIVVIEEC